MKYYKSKLSRSHLTDQDQIQLALMPKQDRKKLTRQDKRFIQKIKNKLSAQKSRDQRKVYITMLQEQILQLKAQNQQLRTNVCSVCRRSLQLQNRQATDVQDVQEMGSQLQMPILIDDPVQWQISERKGLGNGKFFLFLISMFLIFSTNSKTTGTELAQFHSNNNLSPKQPIEFKPYKNSDICLLKTYDNIWKDLQQKDRYDRRNQLAAKNKKAQFIMIDQYQYQVTIIHIIVLVSQMKYKCG